VYCGLDAGRRDCHKVTGDNLLLSRFCATSTRPGVVFIRLEPLCFVTLNQWRRCTCIITTPTPRGKPKTSCDYATAGIIRPPDENRVVLYFTPELYPI